MASLLSSLTSCFNKENKTEEVVAPQTSAVTAEDLKVGDDGLSEAKIIIKTVHGNIAFKLYPKKAPNTVTRIIELTQQGFYDGIIFHRVIPNFVIQGGDPTGTGTSGSGKNLKAEFNDIQHIKGTVAMARAQDVDSADSQFYIALTTLPHLDKSYTVFGQVVEGMEILEKIVQGDKIITMTFQP
ncbi:MAG: peptidylprolyl isomerase [Bdellovibrio sp. CG12_big_fil_rev_8_21_14_0_65_39_13]|nr:MAG: peptidylprolyl isomerase [Bdellovibrio sp. CG22_combo_CG10-13_8_21_14_all_39_27]PIQ61713.1 MAG: peptidylprolyl isomerase [Bdellovibrio sp. CG12_big_fil_rev_8_21_14_0_65_39_13]PIR35656.1 MAG: peptidylprolyl isomerase [Bdellovibrio sp. CG11_big_fil_rev_8_21_14_0_20_39_38]